jgi:hypothetical protein
MRWGYRELYGDEEETEGGREPRERNRQKMGATRATQLALYNLVAPLPGLCCRFIVCLMYRGDNGTKV